MKNMELTDQTIRQRFIDEHDKNFSVIAPAGVGKTTAITKKIASIIRTQAIPLDKLVIVTYTQKAAQELRQRALLEVQKQNGNLFSFQHIFFGTIHALADKILRSYGHFLGIAPDFKIEQNEKHLWNAFLQSLKNNHIGHSNPISTLLTNEKLYALVEKYYATEIHISEIFSKPPKIDVLALLNYSAKNNLNIRQFQNNLRLWNKNPVFHFPKLTTKAEAFSSIYENVMAPFEDWCSMACAREFKQIALEYEFFRIQRKHLTFSDLIKLSTDLLKHEDSCHLLRQYYVILDEAQDTDVQQFQFLLGIAQDSDSNNFDFFKNPPAAGRYCMVGDPQQSIYSNRADVAFYQNIHKTLISIGIMEELIFSVTLRFGPNAAQNVNQSFSNILDGIDKQVPFSKITSGKNLITSNQDHFEGWSRIDISGEVDELTFLSNFFGQKNPADFGVKQWSDIAILCPRKAWLFEIQKSFSKQPLTPKTHIYSAMKNYGEYREFSWIRALIAVVINPNNQFEFSGILREIFGISDTLISQYYQGEKISQILSIQKQFHQCHQKCQFLSPIQVIEFLLKMFDLKARLKAIQGNYFDEIEKNLLFSAVQNSSLLELSECLKRQSLEVFQSESIDEDALQLYTFHKSKGLEWPVVLLPFINRKQTPAPRILPEIIDGKITISNRQYQEWFDSNGTTHNMERLLYVALTRQKQQTIFINDGTEPKMYSTASILQSPHHNKNFIQNLTPFRFIEKNIIENQTPFPFLQNFFTEIKYGSFEQKYFPIRMPSQTFSESQNKFRSVDPLVYGNWWHETMQKCPFKTKKAVTFLRSSTKASPDFELAQRDTEKLIQSTSFWELIEGSEQIFAEYSFFVPNLDHILEGRIDLLLRTKNHLDLIDWKTEHIDNITDFIEKHKAQIQDYQMALHCLFPNFIINANIYGTELGKIISII